MNFRNSKHSISFTDTIRKKNKKDYALMSALYLLTAEFAILQNIVAATNEIDDVSLKRLRGECVKEVTRLKGSLDFDDALDWQKG